MSAKCQKQTFSPVIDFRSQSIHRLRLWEFPRAVQDFGARTIEPHYVIPTRHSRQAVDDLAVAAAELDGHRTVGPFFCGNVVECVSVERVLLEVALCVVDAD